MGLTTIISYNSKNKTQQIQKQYIQNINCGGGQVAGVWVRNLLVRFPEATRTEQNTGLLAW